MLVTIKRSRSHPQPINKVCITIQNIALLHLLATRQFCFKTLETLVKLLQIMFDGGGF